MVSTEIQKYCPNGEEYLYGSSIAEVIPAEAFDDLSGHACVFTVPASGAPDEADEIAYRVDSGLGDLIRAYVTTTGQIDGACPDPIDPITYPFVRVEYDGVGYTVTPGGCGATPVLGDALAALRVTQVARDTATFEEYQEQGF